MNGIKDTISEILKIGLAHSIAQAFLLFSGIFIIICILLAKEYVPLSFFTLFYALINFKMEAVRKHESLGKYAVGEDKWQIILFTLISIFLSVWWFAGAWSFLNDLDWRRWYFSSFIFPSISIYSLIISLVLMIIWLGRMFWKLPSKSESIETKNKEEEDNYELNFSLGDFSLSLKRSKNSKR